MRPALHFAPFLLIPVLLAHPVKVKPDVNHRPSPLPDRIILTWAGDPATTQAVTWRTDITVKPGLAEIALATDGPGFPKEAKRVEATTELLKSNLGEAHYHSVQFTGLQPDTMYVYRVGDGENWSEWNQFRTSSGKPGPLEFIYVGDAQNDVFSMWSRVIRQSFIEAPKTRFIVHAGDLINRSNQDEEWGEWHRAAGWINRSIPSIPTPGNHEYGQRTLSLHWRPQFTLPGNGLPGLEETNYYLDFGDVRMISMNSNERRQEQGEWLDKLLTDSPKKWVLLTFHHPIFSTAKGRDNKDLRESWQPIFDKHGVDLVLTGHDHTYGRTNVLSGMNTRTGRAGTVYVVSVSGPKMYKLDPKTSTMARTAEETQLFQVVRVDGDRLRYESRTARGDLYDAFDLVKRKGRPNTMVNRMPVKRTAPAKRAATTN